MYYSKVKESDLAEKTYKIFEGKNESLMTKSDHSFLCGLLEKYMPKKILEIGVYAGGTTCVILNTLQELGLYDSEVYSVDLATHIHNGREVGYLIEETKEYYSNVQCHQLYTGMVAPEVCAKIGGGGLILW